MHSAYLQKFHFFTRNALLEVFVILQADLLMMIQFVRMLAQFWNGKDTGYVDGKADGTYPYLRWTLCLLRTVSEREQV